MRLLRRDSGDEITLTEPFHSDQTPRYAILSHTWGADNDEVTFADIQIGSGRSKAGYEKIQFCAECARKDGIDYFWVDTCCINKADLTELSEAITSMYRWYQNSEKCYVYLSDVYSSTEDDSRDDNTDPEWVSGFRMSRWFTRGWTLQELLAPRIVEFYSHHGVYLGSKQTLAELIHDTTTIPLDALHGLPLSHYSTAERLRWAERRETKKTEDRAYCLLGIFNVFMPLIYGEGDNAFLRLGKEIQERSKPLKPSNLPALNNFNGVYAHAGLRPATTYVSRSGLEQRLLDQLPPMNVSDNCAEMRTVVVHGFGGSGKSQLALRFLQQQWQDYQAIFWIEAGRKETIERDYIQIFKQIYQQPHQTAGNNATIPVEDAITGVKIWLQQQNQRCLWVMDSADDVDDSTDELYIDLNHYLPESPSLDRIVTTRSSYIQSVSSHEAVKVAEMTEAEAVNLLQQCTKLISNSEQYRQEMVNIVKELGYLPLAVTLAGSYIREDLEMTTDISLYLTKFRQRRAQLLQQKPHRLVHQYGESILSTWEISYTRVKRQSPLAAEILSLLAFLNFNDIFLDLFTFDTGATDKQYDDDHCMQPHWAHHLSIQGMVVDRDSIYSAFKALQAYSIVSWKPEQKAFSMHKLVHTWCQERLDLMDRPQWALAVSELLAGAVNVHSDSLSICSRLVPHIVVNFTAVLSVRRMGYQTTATDHQWFHTTATALQRLGHWDYEYDLRAYLRQETERVSGLEHPDTLLSMYHLAEVLCRQGKYEDAAQQYLDGVRMIVELRSFGDEKMLMIRTLWNATEKYNYLLRNMHGLARACHGQGRYRVAEQLYKTVMSRKRVWFGLDHMRTLRTMNELALVYRSQGNHDEAEELCLRTLELRKKILGQRHPDTLTSMSNLATILYRKRRYITAAILYSQSIELRKTVLGEQHPDTLADMKLLEGIYSHEGDIRDARRLRRGVIMIAEEGSIKPCDDTPAKAGEILAEVISWSEQVQKDLIEENCMSQKQTLAELASY